jgi:hypothetical protein
MPPTITPLTLAQRHTNQQLFSDHSLAVTLPWRPEWQLLALNLECAAAQGGSELPRSDDDAEEAPPG